MDDQAPLRSAADAHRNRPRWTTTRVSYSPTRPSSGTFPTASVRRHHHELWWKRRGKRRVRFQQRQEHPHSGKLAPDLGQIRLVDVALALTVSDDFRRPFSFPIFVASISPNCWRIA